ncbi:MAG: hypothetical protein H5T66_05135, partial [Chloroflexi bacterium]|nr:hypothetical protein [Chloroflexota bacterium]
GIPLTVQTAEQALGEAFRPSRVISAEQIIAETAAYFGLRPEDILGRRRSREVALARQVAMYLTRELTSLSFPQIGEAFGGRDHTTILHGHEKVAALFEKDDTLRRQVLEIKTSLYGVERHSMPAASGLESI